MAKILFVEGATTTISSGVTGFAPVIVKGIESTLKFRKVYLTAFAINGLTISGSVPNNIPPVLHANFVISKNGLNYQNGESIVLRNETKRYQDNPYPIPLKAKKYCLIQYPEPQLVAEFNDDHHLTNFAVEIRSHLNATMVEGTELTTGATWCAWLKLV